MNRKLLVLPTISFCFIVLHFISSQILNSVTAVDDQTHLSFLSTYNTHQKSKRSLQSTNGVNEQSFNALIEKLGSIVLELKGVVESLFSSNEQCRAIVSDCINANYEHCISTFPDPICFARSAYSTINSVCLDYSSSCSTLYDNTTSTVRLPPRVDVTSTNGDPSIVDAICRTKSLDEWFVQKYKELEEYWKTEFEGISPTSMHVGFSNGVFRIYPGRSSASEGCRGYDPTLRPWYSASSGGKKTVILMLDVSSTMGKSVRLDDMKKAARQVISTASVADRLAVVPFDENPRNPTGTVLAATSTNKKQLTDAVNNLNVSTSIDVNYATAFDFVKDMLAEAIGSSETECSVAILLFTDGETKKVDDALREINSIQTDLQNLTDQLGRGEQVFVFVYSMSRVDPTDHNFTSCTEPASFQQGLWSQVDDQLTGVEEIETIPFLKNYYELFQWGMQKENYTDKDRISIVEPYPFYTVGNVGTTISVPVYVNYYDEVTNTVRKVQLGVVGVDYTLPGFNIALNISTDDSTESVNRIVATASNQICPDMSKISPCDLNFYRQNNNQAALCPNSCTSVPLSNTSSSNNFTSNLSSSLEGHQTCVNESDATSILLWNNNNNANKPDIERLCCNASSTTQCSIQELEETPNPTGSINSTGISPPSSSPTTDGGGGGLSTGAIIGIAIGGLMFLIVVVGVVYHYWDSIIRCCEPDEYEIR